MYSALGAYPLGAYPWKILQQKKPDDFVIGTGKQYSVEDFARLAFSMAGLNYKRYVKIDKNLINFFFLIN